MPDEQIVLFRIKREGMNWHSLDDPKMEALFRENTDDYEVRTAVLLPEKEPVASA